jgi:serine/threonine protein kinase
VPSGIGLADLLARREMPPNELAMLIRDLAEVLAFAHAYGVVHRGLSLRSIVLATGPRSFPLVITDWGMRTAGLGVFAAPELTTYAEFDGRADVYSLGVIAFRAATCMFPGEGGVFDVPGVPTGLATLIARMLAIDPNERPTAAEVRALADELIAIDAGDEPTAVTPVPELIRFGDETPPTADDVVYPGGPRFGKPKWTPAPELTIRTSERAPTASGEIKKLR